MPHGEQRAARLALERGLHARHYAVTEALKGEDNRPAIEAKDWHATASAHCERAAGSE